jgi:hypothetical protein
MWLVADRERSSVFFDSKSQLEQNQSAHPSAALPVTTPSKSNVKCMLLNVQDFYSKFMLLSSDWYCFRHI